MAKGGRRAYIVEGSMSWRQDRMVAVKVGIGPTIMLNSGAWFDFCAPSSSEFTIDDIAQGLSNICRYSGQCREFYSVAEHSLLVSEIAEGFEFEALLHDAAEAFLGDVTRPLKQMLPEFKRIEAEVERAILDRFGVEGPMPPQVKQADLRVLAAEQRQIMPEGTDGWVRGQKVDPAPVVVRHLPPEQAKKAFLARFEALHQRHAQRKTKLVP
jgi:5'-deoxynucleotidase YfbR-like HD superfamily hydrolase